MNNIMSEKADLLTTLAKREESLTARYEHLLEFQRTQQGPEEDHLNDIILDVENEIAEVRKQIAHIKEAL